MRGLIGSFGLVLVALALVACDGSSGTDAGAQDAGQRDSGSVVGDAGDPSDAGGEADSGSDAGEVDGGTACTCTLINECCDGCHPISEGETCASPAPGTGGEPTCMEGRCRGEPCECSSGPCCDGCFFRGTDHLCDDEVATFAECRNPSEACPGSSDRLFQRLAERFCSGTASACDGELVPTDERSSECPSGTFCTTTPAGDACGHTCE